MNELFESAKQNEQKIVKLQANWRGFQSRKLYKIEEKSSQKPRPSARKSNRNANGPAAVAR
jgi:hypothetical protein